MNTLLLASSSRNAFRRWASLFGCVALMAIVWLTVLPRIARMPAVADHIQQMEQEHIQVDAMFYTELEWDPPTGAAWR